MSGIGSVAWEIDFKFESEFQEFNNCIPTLKLPSSIYNLQIMDPHWSSLCEMRLITTGKWYRSAMTVSFIDIRHVVLQSNRKDFGIVPLHCVIRGFTYGKFANRKRIEECTISSIDQTRLLQTSSLLVNVLAYCMR